MQKIALFSTSAVFVTRPTRQVSLYSLPFYSRHASSRFFHPLNSREDKRKMTNTEVEVRRDSQAVLLEHFLELFPELFLELFIEHFLEHFLELFLKLFLELFLKLLREEHRSQHISQAKPVRVHTVKNTILFQVVFYLTTLCWFRSLSVRN